MRKILALTLAVLCYTTSALATDAAPRVAQPSVQLADCGAACAKDEGAPGQDARDAAACAGADCARGDVQPMRSSCDDEHPCFDP